MREWERYGFTRSESEMIENFDDDWMEYLGIETGATAEQLYIEAGRREYYEEFYSYLQENEVDIFEY